MGKFIVKIILTVVLLAIVGGILAHQYAIDYHYIIIVYKEIENHPLVSPMTPHLVVVMFILLSFIIRIFLESFEISISISFFTVLLGFLWGIVASHDVVIRLASSFMAISSEECLFFYVPIMIFNIAFCLDVYIFLKTLPQTVVIGVPVFLVTAIIYGFMAKGAIEPTWKLEHALIFGVYIAPIYPKAATLILKQHSTQTKQIAVLLEAEALFTLITTDVIRELRSSALLEITVWWYQYVLVAIWFIMGGLVAGFMFGYLGKYFLRKLYTQKYCAMMICFAFPFVIYSFTEKLITGLGSIPVAVAGVMLGMERTVLSKEIEVFLINMWEVVAFILDTVICARSAMLVGTYVLTYISLREYFVVLAAYSLYFVVRFFSFLLFSCVISRLGYGIDMKEILASLYEKGSTELNEYTFYILGIYCLTHLINASFMGTLLEALGLTRISTPRQMNMNNCMKHLFVKREKTVRVLKEDRFLADANWPVVINSTNLRHPYRTQVDMEDDEDDLFLGYRFTYCPDCQKDVPQEPTVKEFKEMTREAKIRVLKAKKMSYSRQYENGMMSKEGIRLLNQAIELAADSKDAEIKVEDLYNRFTEENWCQRFIRRHLDRIREKKAGVRPPRTYWRRLCYHMVVTNRTYEKAMFLIVFFHVIVIAVDFYINSNIITRHERVEVDDSIEHIIQALNIVFALLYVVEFVVKIMAFSYVYVCAHGFRTYFSSFWNILDFVVMLGCSVQVLHILIFHSNETHSTEVMLNDRAFQVSNVISTLRIIRLARVIETFYLDVFVYIDQAYDSKLSFTYELGKSYATTETEILEMLPYMIDNKEIKEQISKKIEIDRAYITKLLGLVQKERPWIAITVKTTQAIRTILNAKKEAINFLKASGWIDSDDYSKLMGFLETLYQQVSSIRRVNPSPPKVIFKEVAWMAEDERVIEFLFENVTVKSFEPQEEVFTEGTVADGIYIVVTGLLIITYNPDPNILEALNDYGRLPVVDYLSGTSYEDPSVDYIVSGNCMGELSTLTGRSYNCTIKADLYSQVYFLSRGVLRRAMELSPDPAVGLECRIWKEVSVRIAVPLLLSTPAYQAFSQDQIKFALERAFVPDLSAFKTFTVTDVIEDIILIEGVVFDYNTTNYYFAPNYIPRTVQKLILPTSSLMQLPIQTETKLLIIPVQDVEEIEVMLMAEETCELIRSLSSSKCLQHTAQDQLKRRRRQKRGDLGSQSSSRGRRAIASSIGTSVSRYAASTKSTVMSFRNEKSEVGSVFIPMDDNDR